MYNIYFLKKTFVRQSGRYDCGVSCLSMILNFAGKTFDDLSLTIEADDQNGLSLLQLRNLSVKHGLKAQCVEMEISFLRSISCPVILHTTNENGEHHYQVCYGAKKHAGGYKYLMGDPARQIHFLEEAALLLQWRSKAGLYFTELQPDRRYMKKSLYFSLLFTNHFPKGLWISIPLLSVATGALGMAFTWVLQQGLNHQDFLNHGKTTVLLLLLLGAMMVFKCLLAFLRQMLLVIINVTLSKSLTQAYIIHANAAVSNNTLPFDTVQNNLADIQKMQNGVTVLLGTLLSEGCILVTLSLVSFYLTPLLATINFLFNISIVLMIWKKLPTFAYQSAHLRYLTAQLNNALQAGTDSFTGASETKEYILKSRLTIHEKQISFARYYAVNTTKTMLLIECLAAVALISVFSLGIVQLHYQAISSNEFWVAAVSTYLCSTIMPRLSQAFFVAAEGADAAIQHHRYMSRKFVK